MKWGFAGCKQQSVAILQAAITADIPPAIVFTLANTPTDEQQLLSDLASSVDALFFSVDTLDQHQQHLDTLDLLITCRFDLLPQRLFELPKHGSINVHSSLLPHYRGVHPVSWALIRDERETGVTLHQIDCGIDSGDIVIQQAVAISDEDTVWTLTETLSQLSAALVTELLRQLQATAQLLPSIKQVGGDYFYARRRIPTDGEFNWTWPGRDIFNLVRALQSPLPLAYSVHPVTKQQVDFYRGTIVSNEQTDKQPGTVLDANADNYFIQCVDSILALHTKTELAIGDCLA